MPLVLSDWENMGRPGNEGNVVSPQDSTNFLLFLPVLRAALGSAKIIHMSMPAEGVTGPDGKLLEDYSGYSNYVNYVSLMASHSLGIGFFIMRWWTDANPFFNSFPSLRLRE